MSSASQHAPAAGRFVALDGLRGVAALMIAACHAFPLTGYYMENGSIAVDFFFIISGFVIAHAYGKRLESGLTPQRFMILRTIRLYPLYAIGLVLGLIAAAAGLVPKADITPPELMPWAVTLSALMLPTFAGVAIYPFNNPSWSLFFEMVANAVYGVTHRFTRMRVWMTVLLLFTGLAMAVIAILEGSIDVGWQTGPKAFGGLVRVGFSFLAGIAVYRLHQKRPSTLRVSPALMAVLLAALILAPNIPLLWAYQLFCLFVAFPLILYLTAGLVPRERSVAVWSFMGATSYALYATHMPLLYLVTEGAARIFGKTLSHGAPFIGIAFIAGAIVFAHLADRWLDQPLRRLLNARYAARAP